MTAVLVAMVPWAAWGPRQALYAMSLVAVLRHANPAFTTFPPYSGAFFWLIMIIGSGRLLLGVKRVPASFYWLLAFCAFAVAASVAVSKAIDVSVMKAISFFIVSAALLLASDNLSRKDVEQLQTWLVSSIVVIGVLSLLTAPFPTIAYRTNGTGLQGILSHPQQLGVMLAPFIAWALVRGLDNRAVRAHPWELLVILAGVVIIVLTRARTAMLAVFVAVVVTVVVHLFRGRAHSLRKDFAQIAAWAFGLVFVIVVASVATGAVGALIEEIVFKGSGVDTVEEAFEKSRGAGVKQQLEHFAAAPLTGHGFGVYPTGVYGGEKSIVRVLGIPISAPTEKGFAFTAVLEEVGIFGAILFYGLIISMARRAAQSPRPEVLALFLGAVLVNVGEAVIFSPGGVGLFMWLVIALSLSSGKLEERG